MSIFTKRNAAKLAVRAITYSAAVQGTTAAIDHCVDPQTEAAEEAVETGGFIAGSLVALYLWRHTDQVVDRVADWRIARKAEKAEVTE